MSSISASIKSYSATLGQSEYSITARLNQSAASDRQIKIYRLPITQPPRVSISIGTRRKPPVLSEVFSSLASAALFSERGFVGYRSRLWRPFHDSPFWQETNKPQMSKAKKYPYSSQ